MTKQLTFGSLFAGIGGFDLGFERAGMVCKWQVEIDDYATRVLEKHWPDVKRYRDVRECGAANLEPVDVICGGFPCVNISSLGDRAGIEGVEDGSGLWREAIRIVRDIRPGIFVVENVAEITFRGAGNVLGDLAESGYFSAWQCLPAAAFGAPHYRDRFFCLGVDRNALGRYGGAIQAFSTEFIPNAGGSSAVAWRTSESGMGRIANGVPNRVDRNRCLGNAVVPQVAEWIGRRIVEAANA